MVMDGATPPTRNDSEEMRLPHFGWGCPEVSDVHDPPLKVEEASWRYLKVDTNIESRTMQHWRATKGDKADQR